MGIDFFRLNASMSDTGYSNDINYQSRLAERYQEKINNKFDQSSSATTIKEEYPYGSGKFRDLLCRVVSVRTVGTGSKMSDSYKTIIFKDQEHPKNVGNLYKFKNNYWIACNSDIYSSPTDSIVVRRCNNVLRWKDSNGKIQSVPISFEEDALNLNNRESQEIKRSGGYRYAIIQRNSLTKTLEPNQRFIFGKQCLKISGSGIGAFINQYTEDDDSPSIIRLNFEYDYVNTSTDDMDNKIANAFSNEYSVSIDQKTTTYSVSSNPYIFTATVLNNGLEVDRDIIWTVSGSGSFVRSVSNKILSLTFQNTGTYTITASLKDNPEMKEVVDITVVNTDIYSIQCSPITEVIYKGDSETISFVLYKNGQELPDAVFVFEKIDTVTTDYYTYSTSEKSITIHNKKMSPNGVNIKCVVSNYADSGQYDLKIKLGGAW